MKLKIIYWLPLIAFVFTLSSCKENVMIISENDIPDDILYEQDNIKPYTGKCYIYYMGTKTLKEEFSYSKGVLDGVRRSYYSNGQIKFDGYCQKGEMHGNWRKYTDDGALVFDICYNADMPVNCDNLALK